MNLFRIDGLTYKIATKIYQVLTLSILWYITSLPMITIGASTCALFYVSSKLVRGEEIDLLRDYLKAMKANSLKSTLISGVFFIVLVLFIGNMNAYVHTPQLSRIFMVIQALLILEVFVAMIYSYPILSRYDLGLFKTLKAALLIGNKHFGTTIQSIIFTATVVALISIYPALFLLLAPGLIGLSNFYIINPVLVKYTEEI